jgi:exopolyphosphatase/guanosine-5'-triphosphate,3'-diphosphate pyrophosphatase
LAGAHSSDAVLAAIDVGTNSVRLQMARPLSDGTLEAIHNDRDPVRPGEGLFQTGTIPRPVADRLLSTLRRYGALCRRHDAVVRTVATSAMREARNRDEIVRRARREAGLALEVISGHEEAELICLGVLAGASPKARTLCIDIGGGSTEVATAVGERPTNLWSVPLGAVRMTEMFETHGAVSAKKLQTLRDHVAAAIGEGIPGKIAGYGRAALGSSGTIRALVAFAASDGERQATARQLERTVEKLVEMDVAERRRHFDRQRADIVVAGAVILEALARQLSLEAVTAVDRGLRHGVLVDLMRRRLDGREAPSLAGAALVLGRRLGFDERHASQVARIALAIFDQLGEVHGLSEDDRAFLEAAALLHDVGRALSSERHHRHTQYLIENADLPGLAVRERDLVARIARFHRRSPPDLDHAGMSGLSRSEARLVRKLATLLRVADALDRSHHQPVQALTARRAGSEVVVQLGTRAPVDLELWDVAHEAPLFRQVFGHPLRFEVSRVAALDVLFGALGRVLGGS